MPRIAVIPGDGIGPEVTTEAVRVLEHLDRRDGLALDLTEETFGATHYLATGEALSDESLDRLRGADALLFGAMGDPRVAPGILERGFILKLRMSFRQSVNVRPIRLYPGATSPIAGLTPDRCDLVVVRENTEGMYTADGTMTAEGTPYAVAVHAAVTTAAATHACVRYAFELAMRRRRRLTLCHKTNVIVQAGLVWSRAVEEIGEEFPEVEVDYVHADAMTLHLVQRPERFDVVVTDNLFGDIISDLGAAVSGGLGTAASGNLNLDGSAPSFFEAIHGSAPDIAGQGIANPAAAILSAGMMLDHLGFEASARSCQEAVAAAIEVFAADGRPMVTAAFGDEVLAHLA
ncbi:3-isopropylmalate dehydrogenase [Nocardioides sp. GXZ039]|uniref:3-isopropylmalate dehydrogenase n=1 Tax=Nocardioides sp. GXZ039 TaxID=3136018 RepID=UPI0030F4ACC9